MKVKLTSIFNLQLEPMYENCHKAIRLNPDAKKSAAFTGKTKRWNRARMSKAQRDDRVKQKKVSYLRALKA